MIFLPLELFLADPSPRDLRFACDEVLLALPTLGTLDVGRGMPRLPVPWKDRCEEDRDSYFDMPGLKEEEFTELRPSRNFWA